MSMVVSEQVYERVREYNIQKVVQCNVTCSGLELASLVGPHELLRKHHKAFEVKNHDWQKNS
jgi:hypothetical protein